MPEKPQNQNTVAMQYRVLDDSGEYLIGMARNLENMSCSILIYDWVGNSFTNIIVIANGFFNMVFTNLSVAFNLLQLREQF